MQTPKFGSHEGYPVRFNDDEAWIYENGRWRRWAGLAEIHLLKEQTYRAEFGDLPALPKAAFQSAS
jgi:hypothetical protein